MSPTSYFRCEWASYLKDECKLLGTGTQGDGQKHLIVSAMGKTTPRIYRMKGENGIMNILWLEWLMSLDPRK